MEKFSRNVENDRKHKEQLETDGWKVITLWECDINKMFEETMNQMLRELTGSFEK